MTSPRSLDEQARLLRLATAASVTTAAVLVLAKAAAWYVTSSVSLLASLVDSVMDVGASLVNLFAVRYSLKPPDREHRFGHGKSEALAGLGQATFILGSAAFLLVHAVRRLAEPRPLEATGAGIAVMGSAVVATLVLIGIQRHVIRHTGSTAIRADSLHYVTDLLTNVATMAALWLASLGWLRVDALFAVGIAVYILYSAAAIAREATAILMDRELPAEVQERIRTIAREHREVLGVHDVRTRQSGQIKIIQLHLDLDGDLSLREAHRIADEVEAAVRRAFPGADVIIHQDPAGEEESSLQGSTGR
jgi:ferrous-iron efflux pump FieF